MDNVNQQAAAWLARMLAPDCTSNDREACIFWQAEAKENAAAFHRARILFELTGAECSADALMHRRVEQSPDLRIASPAPELSSGLPEADAVAQPTLLSTACDEPAVPDLQHTSRRAWLAAAATVILGVAVLWRLWLPAEPVRYETGAGEIHDIRLDDGSRVTLDAMSVLKVSFSGNKRHLTLQRGRGLFDVAHDNRRPFVVSAGNSEVVALGTRFQVDNLSDAVQVTLVEGEIEVTALIAGQELIEIMQPGEQLLVPQASDIEWQHKQVDAESATAWLEGRHHFRDTRLVDAVAEINRYALVKVRLADENLNNQRISGNFVTGDSVSVSQAIAMALDLRFIEGGREIILLPSF